MSSSTPPTTESLPGTSTSDDSPMYSPNDLDDEESLANIAVALYNPTWKPDQLTFSQVRNTVFSTYFCGFEKEAVMSWADDIERNFQDFVRAFCPSLDNELSLTFVYVENCHAEIRTNATVVDTTVCMEISKSCSIDEDDKS